MKIRNSVPPASSVLFVCMGNICRSPTAEVVFRHLAARAGVAAGLRIDSAGTGGWDVGSPPDRRAIQAARRRGYDLTALRARQIHAEDFVHFGWILAMDESNLKVLEVMRPPDYRGHLGLFLDVAPAPALAEKEVPDPYWGGPEGFEHVLDLTETGSMALLSRLFPELHTT